MISEEDVEKLASAARELAPSASVYLEDDFIMNLLETVLDYMLQTEVVVKALERFGSIAGTGCGTSTISNDDVVATLEREGIEKFVASFNELLRRVANKRGHLAAAA